MPVFTIRAVLTECRVGSRDIEVEAETPEDAARMVTAAIDEWSAGNTAHIEIGDCCAEIEATECEDSDWAIVHVSAEGDRDLTSAAYLQPDLT